MTHTFRKKITLYLLYLRQVSAGLIIYQPIFIPFLMSRGMNLLDVAYLQTAYNLGVLVLDIPAGYFADRLGRKWILLTANSALVIGTCLIAFGHSLSVFILAELFYALAIAMDAGIHSAFLYEWLRSRGKESEYYRYDALGTFLNLMIGAAGTLIAGYFAERDLQLPVLITIVLTSIGIPAASLLVEPQREENKSTRHVNALMQGPRGIIRLIREVLSTPGLRWALGVTVVWIWSRQYINLFISQPYFKSIGLELRHFGILYSILTLSSGLIALFSRRLIQKPDLRIVSAVGLFLIPTCFGIMGFVSTMPGLAGFFIFAIPYGLTSAITNTLLNRQFSEHENRATFLAIVDFFVRLVSSALALSLGWLLAHHGASSALLGAMIVSGIFALCLLPGIFKYARS